MLFEHRVTTEEHDSRNVLEWRLKMGVSGGSQQSVVYMEARVPPAGQWQKIVHIDQEGKLRRYAFGSYPNAVPLPREGRAGNPNNAVIALASTF